MFSVFFTILMPDNAFWVVPSASKAPSTSYEVFPGFLCEKIRNFPLFFISRGVSGLDWGGVPLCLTHTYVTCTQEKTKKFFYHFVFTLSTITTPSETHSETFPVFFSCFGLVSLRSWTVFCVFHGLHFCTHKKPKTWPHTVSDLLKSILRVTAR